MVARDGEKAIALLEDQAADPALRKSDFVLLDLNLPRRDGTEVLRMIRSTRVLADLPVAILSSSPGDVIEKRLTTAHVTADAHFTKPGNIEDFLKLGEVLRNWYQAHTEAKDSEASD